MSIAGKVILITGGSSGIGRQLAGDMAARGAKVIICSHDMAKLEKAAADLKALGHTVAHILCDVTSQVQIEQMRDKVLADFGHLDILVNNAGYAVYETFEESSAAEVVRLIEVNLLGTIRCTKTFLPSMIARRSGSIVNIASIAGRLIITPNCCYGAAKHGMVALSEALKYELGHFGVNVNVVCPGRVETAFFDHETFKKRTPRKETQYTIPIEKVSACIIAAIEKNRFISYVPWTLGALVWLTNAFPFIIKPLYGRLLTSRIETIYATKKA